MAIIVAGKLTIQPGRRDEFVARSIDAVVQARAHNACEDFSVSADPVDAMRVNIFEKWQSRAALDAFRGAGPESDLFTLVESFHVDEYEV
jgi:quinol monooxygenase YgiN